MHSKTMEGLTGASTNFKVMQTPIRVFKEARRRGDIAVMERAMEYAGDFAQKTHEYQAEAEEGMEKDAELAKEKAKAEQEKMIEKLKRERAEQEEKITGEKENDADTVEISEEGKLMLEMQKDDTTLPKQINSSGLTAQSDSAGQPAAGGQREGMIYTSTGAVQGAGKGSISISV
ncbi:MAG: hypothetical protein HFH41_00120 [Lachnospiraceae bacterium]|nr:hypothetical protein [Lachnospiraceae bacterium]